MPFDVTVKHRDGTKTVLAESAAPELAAVFKYAETIGVPVLRCEYRQYDLTGLVPTSARGCAMFTTFKSGFEDYVESAWEPHKTLMSSVEQAFRHRERMSEDAA
jgi:hypothetical protein